MVTPVGRQRADHVGQPAGRPQRCWAPSGSSMPADFRFASAPRSRDFPAEANALRPQAAQVRLALPSVRTGRRRGGARRRRHSPVAGQQPSLGLERRRRHARRHLQRTPEPCMPSAPRTGRFNPDGLLDAGFPADPVAFCRSQTNAGLGLLARQFRHHGLRHLGAYRLRFRRTGAGHRAQGDPPRPRRLHAGGRLRLDAATRSGLSGFCLLGALSTDNDTPERASRPFDATRNGFVLGEGAGFLVLEEWEAARARGARIYAELAGDGNSLSSYRITDSHPSGDGPIQAMQQALADARVGAGIRGLRQCARHLHVDERPQRVCGPAGRDGRSHRSGGGQLDQELHGPPDLPPPARSKPASARSPSATASPR